MSNVLTACFEAKKQHSRVYYLATPLGPVIYRPLSLREHKAIVGLVAAFNPQDINDLIVKTAVLYFERDIDWLLLHSPGNFIDQVADFILKSSKFRSETSLEEDIETYRDQLGDFDNIVSALIAKAFPNFPRNQIQDLSYDELLRMVTIAEMIVGPLPVGRFKEKGKRGRRPIQPGFPEVDLSQEAADRPPI